jgi:hypothetical protein
MDDAVVNRTAPADRHARSRLERRACARPRVPAPRVPVRRKLPCCPKQAAPPFLIDFAARPIGRST